MSSSDLPTTNNNNDLCVFSDNTIPCPNNSSNSNPCPYPTGVLQKSSKEVSLSQEKEDHANDRKSVKVGKGSKKYHRFPNTVDFYPNSIPIICSSCFRSRTVKIQNLSKSQEYECNDCLTQDSEDFSSYQDNVENSFKCNNQFTSLLNESQTDLEPQVFTLPQYDHPMPRPWSSDEVQRDMQIRGFPFKIRTLGDSGCTASAVSVPLAQELLRTCPSEVSLRNHAPVGVVLFEDAKAVTSFSQSITISIRIPNGFVPIECAILSHNTYHLVLGSDFASLYDAYYGGKRKTIYFSCELTNTLHNQSQRSKPLVDNKPVIISRRPKVVHTSRKQNQAVFSYVNKETIHFPYQHVVSLDRSYELPANSRCQIQVSCPVSDGDYVLYQSDLMVNPSLTFNDSLVNFKGGVAYTLVENNSPRVAKLVSCNSLGVCEPMSLYRMQKAIDPPKIPKAPKLTDDEWALIKKGSAVDTPEKEAILRNLCDRYRDCIAITEEELGDVEGFEIDFEPEDKTPFNIYPFRMSERDKDQMKEHLDRLIACKCIGPSDSPYGSPAFLVPKKLGKTRMVTDFRLLNLNCPHFTYPIPNVNECIEQLSGMKIFGTLDCLSGFHQIRLSPASRKYTAFSTPFGKFEWYRLPFGLKNSPAYYQRMMDVVLGNLKWSVVKCFIDDVMVPGEDWDSWLERLEACLYRASKYGLKFKAEKMNLGFEELEFLGHIVSKDGIKVDPKKVQAVQNVKVPKTVRQVRSFLGMAGYYRRFIQDFSRVAAPLHYLTKDNVAFLWDAECQYAFDHLKSALVSAPVLHYPDFNAQIRIVTDGSSLGYGAIAEQSHDGKIWNPIAYASRSTKLYEKKYAPTMLEACAVEFGLDTFRHYIQGRPVILHTDHRALTYLNSVKHTSGKLARLAIKILSYDIQIVYQKGKSIPHADFLSRNPVKLEDLIQVDDGEKSSVAMNSFSISSSKISSYSVPLEARSAKEIAQADDVINSFDSLKWSAFIEAQRNCDYCRPKISHLLDYLLRSSKGPKDKVVEGKFGLFHGILYRMDEDDFGDTLWRLVIPPSMAKFVFATWHFSKYGHSGAFKTFYLLKSRYFWPKMFQTIQDWCRKCHTCRLSNARHHAIMSKFVCVTPPENSFERIHVDFIESLPITKKKMCNALTVTCATTRFTFCFPTKGKTTNDVLNNLDKIFALRLGKTKVIVTDGGAAFKSAQFKEYLRKHNIELVVTVPHHHRGQGLVERSNGKIRDNLRKRVCTKQHNWDTELPDIVDKLNAERHVTTGFSPHYLVYGCEKSLSLDKMFPINPFSQDAFKYAKLCSERAAEARKLAVERTIAAQERRRKVFESKYCEPKFEIGSWVYYRYDYNRPGVQKKLTYRYVGPYRINKQINDNSFEIEFIGYKNFPKPSKKVTTANMEQLELAPFQSWKEMDEVNDVLDTRSVALSIDSEAKPSRPYPLPKLDLPMSRRSSISSNSSSSSSSDNNNNDDDDYRPTVYNNRSHVPTRVQPTRAVRLKTCTIVPTIISTHNNNAHDRLRSVRRHGNSNYNNNVAVSGQTNSGDRIPMNPSPKVNNNNVSSHNHSLGRSTHDDTTDSIHSNDSVLVSHSNSVSNELLNIPSDPAASQHGNNSLRSATSLHRRLAARLECNEAEDAESVVRSSIFRAVSLFDINRRQQPNSHRSKSVSPSYVGVVNNLLSRTQCNSQLNEPLVALQNDSNIYGNNESVSLANNVEENASSEIFESSSSDRNGNNKNSDFVNLSHVESENNVSFGDSNRNNNLNNVEVGNEGNSNDNNSITPVDIDNAIMHWRHRRDPNNFPLTETIPESRTSPKLVTAIDRALAEADSSANMNELRNTVINFYGDLLQNRPNENEQQNASRDLSFGNSPVRNSSRNSNGSNSSSVSSTTVAMEKCVRALLHEKYPQEYPSNGLEAGSLSPCMRRAIESAVEDCHDIRNFEFICNQSVINYANIFEAHWSQLNQTEREQYDAFVVSGIQDLSSNNESGSNQSVSNKSTEKPVESNEQNSNRQNNSKNEEDRVQLGNNSMAHGTSCHTPSKPSVFTRTFTNSNRRRPIRSNPQTSTRTFTGKLEVRERNNDGRAPYLCTRSKK